MSEILTNAIEVGAMQKVYFAIDSISYDSAVINYFTLPGNNPNANKHIIAYWKNCTDINFKTPPTQVIPIKGTASCQHERVNFNITTAPGILAYGTAPYNAEEFLNGKHSFCAFASFQGAKLGCEYPKSINMEITKKEVSYVQVSIALPKTSNPKKCGSWIGVWKHEFSYGSMPEEYRSITQEKENFDIKIEMGFERSTNYYVCYGMNGYSEGTLNEAAIKTTAAIASFQTGK